MGDTDSWQTVRGLASWHGLRAPLYRPAPTSVWAPYLCPPVLDPAATSVGPPCMIPMHGPGRRPDSTASNQPPLLSLRSNAPSSRFPHLPPSAAASQLGPTPSRSPPASFQPRPGPLPRMGRPELPRSSPATPQADLSTTHCQTSRAPAPPPPDSAPPPQLHAELPREVPPPGSMPSTSTPSDGRIMPRLHE